MIHAGKFLNNEKKCVKSNNNDARNINDVLYYELLVNIFMALNVVELATVSRVCKIWREVRSDPKLWHNLLTYPGCKLGSWKDSSERLTKVLRKILTQIEVRHIRCFVFNYHAYLIDEHLFLVAERTPNLKMLVLPAIYNLSKEVIEHAINLSVGLESIIITLMINHKDIFPAIGKYYKGITGLKLNLTLIEHTPNLKFLSLQSII
ncbi:hypothetical protein HN51_069522, partial [Arachis hypogaea]